MGRRCFQKRERIRSVAVIVAALLAGATAAGAADCIDGTLCACGDTIPAGARVVLSATAPLATTNCTTSPAVLVKRGARLDLGGQRIRCDNSHTKVGVWLDESGATVANGAVVDGCKNGVLLAGVGGHSVKEVVVRAAREGIRIDDENTKGSKITSCTISDSLDQGISVLSRGNTLKSNHVLDSNIGLRVYGNDNKVVGNVITGASSHGITHSESDLGGVTSKNLVMDSGGDCIHDQGGGRKITKNRCLYNAGSGINLSGTGTTVSGNSILGSGAQGIVLTGAANVVVAKNVVNANSADGIDVSSGTSFTIAKNETRGNGSAGIRVRAGVSMTTVTANRAVGNPTNDLRDENVACGSNTWSGNTFGTTNAPSCVH